jgi:hypothetical protein
LIGVPLNLPSRAWLDSAPLRLCAKTAIRMDFIKDCLSRSFGRLAEQRELSRAELFTMDELWVVG